MASSRSSTPTALQSPYDDNAVMLTPRSKIKAVLAAFSDDSSDDEPKTKRSTTSKPVLTNNPPKPPPQPVETPLFLDVADDSDSSTGSADDEPRPAARPRGKLAGRMMGLKRDPAPDLRTGMSKKGAHTESDDEDPISTVSRRNRKASSVNSPPAGPQPEILDSEDSDDGLPENLFENARFMNAVARKRREREEREAQEKKEAEERQKREAELQRSESERSQDVDVDGDTDMSGPKPQRKAGKKALEEMHKETLRIQRNMQLAHQARPRIKISKQSLFEKFNFKPPGYSSNQSESSTFDSTIPEPQPGTTPVISTTEKSNLDSSKADDDLPEFGDIFAELKKSVQTDSKLSLLSSSAMDVATSPRPKIDKGKGRALPEPTVEGRLLPEIKVILPFRTMPDNDSDDDLEIIDPVKEAENEKKKIIASISSKTQPVVSPRKIQKAGKIDAKTFMRDLMQRAREQAVKERDERIADLRAKGVIILTAEEREKQQQEIEDYVEKARQEALAIKRREKKEAKAKEDYSGGSDDDEEWLMEMSNDEEEGGEEEEEMGSGDEEDREEDDQIMMEETEESGNDDERSDTLTITPGTPAGVPQVSDMADSDDDQQPVLLRKASRKKRVIADDDDEDMLEPHDMVKEQPSSTSAIPDIPDIFKNPAFQRSPVGLTQLFAAGSPSFNSVPPSPISKLDALRQAPSTMLNSPQAPLNPCFIPSTQLENLYLGSQQSELGDSGPKVDLISSQSQVEMGFMTTTGEKHYGSQAQPRLTQDMPDPTQDGGFDHDASPAPPRFMSPAPGVLATMTTTGEGHKSPRPPKRGKLRRIIDVPDRSDSEEALEDTQTNLKPISTTKDAFTALQKASRKAAQKEAQKASKEAKEMFEEQALESDDEYAGLGGVSDDDSENDELLNSEMRDLIDNGPHEVDESEIAAFYAEREKAQDQKEVNKLFRDIQHGLLRRNKRGAGVLDDMDDSDDEYLAQERRRRLKRRQIAQIRKQLLENGNLEKIANNPKKKAFWKMLEDASDRECDFLDARDEDVDMMDLIQGDSQSQGEDMPAIPHTKNRTQPEKAEENESNSPPGESSASRGPVKSSRRTVRTTKPALAEIRQTLSFLAEDPCSQSGSHQHSSESESESESNPETSSSAAPDITAFFTRRRTTTTTIIDRTTLSCSSASQSSLTKLAFSANSSSFSDSTGFQPPSLLRRATTSASSGTGESQSTVTERALLDTQLGKNKMGAGVRGGCVMGAKAGNVKSSVNWRKRRLVEREERKECKNKEGRREIRKVELDEGRFE